jgi:hypothetical protein
MTFDFVIASHEYEAGSVFDDAICYGATIEVGNDETFEWFRERGFEGNGYTRVSESASQEADAAQSRVGPTRA